LALLLSLGYIRCEVDYGLFFYSLGGRLLFVIATHVDDFRYGGTVKEVARFETALLQAFDFEPVTVGHWHSQAFAWSRRPTRLPAP